MSIAALLEAAEYLDRREREQEHGYASSLPMPETIIRSINNNRKQKSKKSTGNRKQSYLPKDSQHSTAQQRNIGSAKLTTKSKTSSRTSSSSRQQLALQRLEEERNLALERDKKYLDEKYAILNAGSTSSGTYIESETSARRTEEWVKNQQSRYTQAKRKVTFNIEKQSTSNEPTRLRAATDVQNQQQTTQVPWLGTPPVEQKSTTTEANHNSVVNLTAAQLLARQAVSKDLPIFEGDPAEWPIFYSSYTRSTQRCGFSSEENLGRLQRCLKGNAKEAVKSKLLLPETVPQVINTLKMLYGKPEQILRVLMKRTLAEQPVNENKLETLIKFSLSVQNLCDTIVASDMRAHLNNPVLLQDLIDKLPASMKLNWAMFKQTFLCVNLSTFSEWLNKVAEAASSVTNIDIPFAQYSEKKISPRPVVKRSFTHATNDNYKTPDASEENNVKLPSDNITAKCNKCKKIGHFITGCTEFLTMGLEERWNFVQTENLCRRCLGKNHFTLRCRRRKICEVNGCKMKHHPTLHDPKKHQDTSATVATVSVLSQHRLTISNHNILFRIIPVILYGKTNTINTFAFLDEGSSITLLDEAIAEELQLDGPSEGLCLRWTGDTTREEDKSRRVALQISGIQPKNKKYFISDVRTVSNLNLPVQSLQYDESSKKYRHLKNLPIQNYENASPRILIGLQNWNLGLPMEIREGQWGEPIAAKTRLGWTIFGHYSDKLKPNEMFSNYHSCGCKADTALHKQVKEFFSTENFGVHPLIKAIESQEDKRASAILEKTTRNPNGHYETGLLWRYDNIIFPNSLPMAKRRFSCLERKMQNDQSYAENLKQQISDYVKKGYARKLTEEEAKVVGSRTWYLPIFTVTNPNKPEKIRIVWDAAAVVNGISLNSMLLKGPDLLSPLLEILLRFRERKVGVCGDIREMFHQIMIPESDQDSQRFLWRDMTSSSDPDVYVMRVLTFGAACSPSVAQYVKNMNAKKYLNTHSRAAKAVLENHYVDDWLDSFDTTAEAIAVIKDTKMIHSNAGFEIRNWQSNSKSVIEALGEKSTSNKKCFNEIGDSASAKVLGMWWETSSDAFYFKINYQRMNIEILNGSRHPTKREVLKTLMMIFDPLGLIAFFLIYVKILLQDIWRSAIEWDMPITDEHQTKWMKWVSILPNIEQIEIPRCYSEQNLCGPTDLHIFVDASENAFAAVAYFRLTTDIGISTRLVSAKTKVAPQKPLSIPRLELQAAVLGTRLAVTIEKSHSLVISRRIFWSDSANVLCWLNSDHKKYKQYVAFRIGEILESTESSEWRWIPTKLNVADEATKWKTPFTITSVSRWFAGPEFLLQPEDQWPVQRTHEISAEEEFRSHLSHVETSQIEINTKNLTPDANRFSSWRSMVRTQAYVLRFFYHCKRNYPSKILELSAEEEIAAEKEIIRSAQKQVYANELLSIKKDRNIKISKTSPIYKMSPFIDENGVLRMRSRLKPEDCPNYEVRNPILLPKSHRVTELIVDSYHRKYHHQNFETVVNELRQRFNIPKLRVLLKKIRSKCQHCKNKKAKPTTPEMSELPSARLATFKRPFSHAGIDLFGPLEVVVGRHTEKRWVMLFTCLTIRAVHLEIVYSLSQDSCIMGIRNFVARRGMPLEIYTDNGTNFRGADKELRCVIEQTSGELQGDISRIKWKFIPPASPHMGGCWERLVRSVKTSLASVIPTRKPNDELLRTCLMEVEHIVNSRPLTFVSTEPDENEAITPNHFLLGSSSGVKPAGEFTNDVLILRKNWQISQRLTQLFWKRWIKEYMPMIARRTKWFEKTKPIEKYDVVILMDDSTPNSWKKGIVIDTVIGNGAQVRQVTIKTPTGIYVRPAVKVAVLDVFQNNSKLNQNETQLTRGENVTV